MKVVILCGGLGSRLAEETKKIPKPMVKIGGKPILVHIITIYQKYGFNEFILASGYKSKVIEKYFNKKKNINVVNTGLNTLTGKRLYKLKNFFKKDENFMLTYGDGLSSQNLTKLLKFHEKNKKIATVTAVRPPVRFGELKITNNNVTSFREKLQSRGSWINGGFFVFNYRIFNYINDKNSMLEVEPINKLVKNKELNAFKHQGFWQCMDTLRDKNFLNNLLKRRKAPWI